MTAAREPIIVPLEIYVILKHQKNSQAKTQTPFLTEETHTERNYSFLARSRT